MLRETKGRAALQVTCIDRDDLKPALIGMSMVKGKMLLRKAPAAKEILDTDTFTFNDKFRSPHLKIRFAAAGAQKEVRACACCLTMSTSARGEAPGKFAPRPRFDHKSRSGRSRMR